MKPALNGFRLKGIAILAMALDHIGYVFYPEYTVLRIIGRLTMPIMAYMAAEGYSFTRSKKKYLKRLLLFGFFSQPFYMLAFSTRTPNVLFTIAGAIGILYLQDSLKNPALKILLGALLIGLSASFDWGIFGVLMILVFYRYRGDRTRQFFAFSLVALGMIWVQAMDNANWAVISLGVFGALPLLALYDGTRGKDLRYLFYVFYPAHLGVLAALRFFLS